MPVLLAENTLCAIGVSITATYWIILLGAGSSFVLLTTQLDTNTYSQKMNDQTLHFFNYHVWHCWWIFLVSLINPGENGDSGDVMPYVKVFDELWPRRTKPNSTCSNTMQCFQFWMTFPGLWLFNLLWKTLWECAFDGGIWSLVYHGASASLVWDTVKFRCWRDRMGPWLCDR